MDTLLIRSPLLVITIPGPRPPCRSSGHTYLVLSYPPVSWYPVFHEVERQSHVFRYSGLKLDTTEPEFRTETGNPVYGTRGGEE